MRKPRLILMTVGTSMLTNLRKEQQWTPGPDELYALVSEQLQETPCSEPGKQMAQELSYLCFWMRRRKPEEPRDRVALLASDTERGKAAAQVIRRVLCDLGPFCEHYQPVDSLDLVPGLQTTDCETFRKVGVPTLIEAMLRRGESEDCSEIILNVTGGFKGAIPFATIASAFFPRDREVRLHYLFENSPDILELPLYPIGLDFGLWHREANLLEASAHHDIYLQAMDPRMRDVAVELQASEPTAGRTLPRLLNARYLEDVRTDPLQEFSLRVIRQFIENPRLRAPLERLILSVGPRIWLGDKLPMAADHAQRHHHNLLEIAQLFLTPLCQWHPEFLSDTERFVLLASVLLHDCGHTLDSLPLRGSNQSVLLMPTEVRRLHHFLAYHRLTEPALRRELGWLLDDEELNQAVALLCLYHRKCTGWDDEEPPVLGKRNCPYIEMQFPSPVRNDTVRCVDLPRLVALLRLIDGCDNQSRRVGANIDRDMVKRCLDRDADTWRTRLEQVLPAARQASSGRERELLDRLAGGHPKSWSSQDDHALWKLRIEVARKLAERPEEPGLHLFDAAAQAFDNWRLRHGQEAHFVKHEAVHWIRIRPAEGFSPSCLHYQVVLVPTEDQRLASYLDCPEFASAHGDAMGGKPSLRKWIEGEVLAELDEPAALYLCERLKASFRIEFCWEGEPPFDTRPSVGSLAHGISVSPT